MTEQKSILITGCSSGIGYTCALGMKQRGWRVFATARKPEDLKMLEEQGLEAFYLDYAEPKSIALLAQAVLERTDNKLFALFNNGAYGQPGFIEDITPDVLRAQFEANVFGWHDLICRLLPAMRQNNRGRIVQCSSVLGIVAMKWRGPYNASKFAIEALSDTLRLELDETGIEVISIQPGPIRSRFVATAMAKLRENIVIDNSPRRAIYLERLEKQEKISSNNARALETPEASAARTADETPWWKPAYRLGPDAVLKALIHAVESDRPRLHYRVTMATTAMAYARRLLPARWLYRMALKGS